MRFTVPQFIEQEIKIVWIFTFRQFIFVAISGVICVVIWSIGLPLYIFVVACIVLGGGSLALAFLKIGGRSLPVILANVFKFSVAPKMYIWHKRGAQATVFKKEIKKIKKKSKSGEEEEEFEDSVVKLTKDSKLKQLNAVIETKKE